MWTLPLDLVRGTLDLLILKTLTSGGLSNNNRRATYCQMTADGRRHLRSELEGHAEGIG